MAWPEAQSTYIKYDKDAKISVQLVLWSLLCNLIDALAAITEDDTSSRQFGVELTADQWQPWDFDPLHLSPQHFAVRFASQSDCRLQEGTLCIAQNILYKEPAAHPEQSSLTLCALAIAVLQQLTILTIVFIGHWSHHMQSAQNLHAAAYRCKWQHHCLLH